MGSEVNEREAFEEWAKSQKLKSLSSFDVWQAGRSPLLKEIEQLNAKVAMMREALEYHQEQTRPISKTQDALSSTEQDVQQWVNNVKADAYVHAASRARSYGDDWQGFEEALLNEAKQLRGEQI